MPAVEDRCCARDGAAPLRVHGAESDERDRCSGWADGRGGHVACDSARGAGEFRAAIGGERGGWAARTPSETGTMPEASVIIVGYNTRRLLLDCLRSLYEQTHEVAMEVLVVDNASHDGSPAAITAEFPQVHLVASATNLGFAAANNLAAQEARGTWLLLLNPDTVVLDGAIDRLVAFARAHPEGGIFGGRTLSPDGRLNASSCWARPTLWSVLCGALGLERMLRHSRWFNPEAMPAWQRDTVRTVDIVTGCFLLLRRSLWCELRGLDPAYFLYGEDADLCLRAAARGVRCVHCPDAEIVHFVNGSGAPRVDKLVRLFQSRARLYRRHWTFRRAELGVVLLRVHVMLRVWAYRLAGLGGRPGGNGAARIWQAVWEQRSAWAPARRAARAVTVQP